MPIKNLEYGTTRQDSVQSGPNIPVLSFFTGAGFLDIGFMRAGFDIIWHNEYNVSFAQGFRYGISRLKNIDPSQFNINYSSIEELDTTKIEGEAFLGGLKPLTFGVIGGPPCPDFSAAGKNRGSEGNHGKLSQVYVDRILGLKPSFFFFENVPGLLRTHKHRLYFVDLLRQLATFYLLDVRTLNALDYGVPQDRERVFVVGFNKNWIGDNYGASFLAEWDNWVDWRMLNVPTNLKTLNNRPSWFSWPEPLYPDAKITYNWPKINPFGEEPLKPSGIPDELMAGNWICDPAISQLPNGLDAFHPYSNKFHSISEGNTSKKSFKRLHRWRYSPAVAYGNNEVHLHPVIPRRLTVREALRLQTVPDEYELPVEMPLTHKFKVIGNGIPIKLAKYMGDALLSFCTQH
jgi:DNA (cytosine-5)-methyltransferase 1